MSANALSSRAILGRLFLRLELGALGWVDRLSFFVSSDQASEEHKWLGMSPVMREWLGGRLVHGLRDFGFVIKNKKFEVTLEIPLDWIRRDKTGQIQIRIDSLAGRANSHGALLLSDLIINGESSICYDGQFFFDTDHVEGSSGIQSNDISVDISTLPVPVAEQGSIAAPGPKVMRDVILLAIQQMLGFKDDQGEPLNEGATEFVVMVPNSLWTPAVTAVGVPQLGGGETNILANLDGFSIGVVNNPRLTWADKISVFRADRNDGVAPFIRQEEKPLNVAEQTEGSPEEFNNDRWVFGIDFTGNFGYGFWQHAVLATMV